MAVNFGLLQPAQPVSAFFQGQQDVRQQADQNMLRQMQAEKQQMERENMLAQRGERQAIVEQRTAQAAEVKAKTAAAAQRQQFLTGLGAKMAEGGYKLDRPTLGQMLQFGMQTGEDSLIKLATEGMRALDEEALYSQEATRFGLPGAAAPAAAPANALAAPAAPAGVTRETVQNMLMSPSARIREQGKALVQTLEKPERPYEPTEVEKLTNALRNAPPGSPEAQALQNRLRILTTREPKEAKEPAVQPPIAVVDDATGRIKYVTREEAMGKTPAAAVEGLTPKERQQREAKFPQATSAVKTFETTSNTLIKDLEKLATHPGLGSITGIAAGRLPGITSAGREAEALFDKIVARGGFQELQNMRQASPTGGALGNVSNQEGAQLRQAFAALDRRQDAPSVRKAITDAINQIRTSQQTIKDAYDMTYDYKQGGGGASLPTPAATKSGATVSNW